MKNLIVLFFLVIGQISIHAQKQQSIEIVDLSIKQVRLMENYKNHSSERRNAILVDSLFIPYQDLWKGYLGEKAAFLDWLNNTAYSELEIYKHRVKEINIENLTSKLEKQIKNISKLTNKEGSGKWYLFFGPKWTNGGSLGDGIMLIDLAHDTNISEEEIQKIFDHEINHQIYNTYNKRNNNGVLYRLINEGFAVYVDSIINTKTKAKALGYTKEELEFCLKNEAKLINAFSQHFNSDNRELEIKLSARNHIFKEGYPGALGYFIGFRIVEEFVKNNGEDSWKEIYDLSPEKTLELSGILSN